MPTLATAPAEGVVSRKATNGATNGKLSMDNINPHVVEAQYAVRGAIVIRAGEIEKELASGASLPFKKLVYCNIGNPQQLGQKPITFNRQVGALCDYPELRDIAQPGAFPSDVIERADKVITGVRSTGAYSHSKGAAVCREMVAAGIEERDGFPANPENIFMTDGASPGVHNLLRLTVRNPEDAWLVPIPQYPLYSAGLKLAGGTLLPYYLDEKAGWSLNTSELQELVDKARAEGVTVRAMAVINPGNPTGQCLSKENQADIINFCLKNNLLLIADEVYQSNVYVDDKQFHSFKKVRCELGAEDLQLASLHSISKGFLGECGRRGGYVEIVGLPEDVMGQLYKLASVNLCPNLSGQISMANQMQPPKPGEPSYLLYSSERGAILDSLKDRAKMVSDALNQLEGVSCQPAEGAMYCFPSITLPEAAVSEALSKGQAPDFMYCMQCLEATGLVTVPGSGFKQVDGTWHFRTTFLPNMEDIKEVMSGLSSFHQQFMDKYRA